MGVSNEITWIGMVSVEPGHRPFNLLNILSCKLRIVGISRQPLGPEINLITHSWPAGLYKVKVIGKEGIKTHSLQILK